MRFGEVRVLVGVVKILNFPKLHAPSSGSLLVADNVDFYNYLSYLLLT